MESLADREGFIVIYPEGIGIPGFLQDLERQGASCGKAVEDNWNVMSPSSRRPNRWDVPSSMQSINTGST
ncbi:MAG: hypothetical protein MZV64_31265 [Ignavibacteriales bacterium]|nr:hypothetical protein [Ignavibacteriales bacterium]